MHRSVAEAFLVDMAGRFGEAGVELRGCAETCRILPAAKKAQESDWPAEYLDLILAVKVVKDMDEALAHIAEYSSNHSEAIVTGNYERAKRFVREADSSVVLVNASTRFNDGGTAGTRCRNRHQHFQTACFRTHGGGGINHHQIRSARQRSDSRIAPYSAFWA